MLACRIYGHRYRFSAEGAAMLWSCERCDAVGGVKQYASPEQASRYAAAFDAEDRDELGRRAPLFGLLPLRIGYMLRNRHR